MNTEKNSNNLNIKCQKVFNHMFSRKILDNRRYLETAHFPRSFTWNTVGRMIVRLLLQECRQPQDDPRRMHRV